MSRITTPFSVHSTASDIIEGINLTGRRAIVTGGASGIGIETPPIAMTTEASDGTHETRSRSKTALQKGGFANGY